LEEFLLRPPQNAEGSSDLVGTSLFQSRRRMARHCGRASLGYIAGREVRGGHGQLLQPPGFDGGDRWVSEIAFAVPERLESNIGTRPSNFHWPVMSESLDGILRTTSVSGAGMCEDRHISRCRPRERKDREGKCLRDPPVLVDFNVLARYSTVMVAENRIPTC
jgi:hypothetical protein